jgi:hypothetical protein
MLQVSINWRENFNGSYSGRVEVGNGLVMSWIREHRLTPYGALQVTAFDLSSYAESVVHVMTSVAGEPLAAAVTHRRSGRCRR